MIESRSIVLDANILLRAVFGVRVRELFETYGEAVSFYAPEYCFDEARRHLPTIAFHRRSDLSLALHRLEELKRVVQPMEEPVYFSLRARAMPRIEMRDPDDWPVIAVALLLNCPIWTEDRDFFGTGVATWTSDRVELYLRGD